MSISASKRFRILSRDSFTCRYCGASGVQLHVDHVIPRAASGTDDDSNLVCACERCNIGKSDTPLHAEAPTPVEIAAHDAMVAERRRALAARVREHLAAEEELRAASVAAYRTLDAYWRERYPVWGGEGLPSQIERALPRLLSEGVTVAMMREAIDHTTRVRTAVTWIKAREFFRVTRELRALEETAGR